MRKNLIALSVGCAMALTLSARVVSLQKGWNLMGALSDINVTAYFNNTDVLSVWTYKNGDWKVYLPNNTNLMTNLPDGISRLDTIIKEKGYWILTDSAITINLPDVQNGGGSGGGGGNCTRTTRELLSPLSDFALSNVAGKTFTLYSGYSSDYSSNLGYTLRFDSQGVANVTTEYNNLTFKYENNAVNVYDDAGKKVNSFKIVASDSNGIIVVSIKNSIFYFQYWGTAPLSPQDMRSLLPLTIYTSWGGKIRYDANGSVETTYDQNHTNVRKFHVENKALATVYDSNWSDDRNITHFDISRYSIQFVSDVGDYKIMKLGGNGESWYIDQNLIGKSWNDLVGTDYLINNSFKLGENGLIVFNYNSDNNATYIINSDANLTINYTYCLDANRTKCHNWKETYLLDSSDGNVSSKYDKFLGYDVGRTDEPFVEKRTEPCNGSD